jgi:hypothetical protein
MFSTVIIKTRIFLVGIFLVLIGYQAGAQKVTEVDICVYGGNSAGINNGIYRQETRQICFNC